MLNSMTEKSRHQHNVEAFMLRAKQDVPLVPTEPSPETRILRAKLILEEVLETITHGLGVNIALVDTQLRHNDKAPLINSYVSKFDFEVAAPFNMEETIDGCCDIKVVTTGCLSACGIPDEVFQEEVDNNNLAKFQPGHYWREDGKLMKPPGHSGPRIFGILRTLKAALGLDIDGNPYLASRSKASQADRPDGSSVGATSSGVKS